MEGGIGTDLVLLENDVNEEIKSESVNAWENPRSKIQNPNSSRLILI